MPNAGEGIFWGDAQSDPKRKYRFFFYLGGVPVWVVKSVSAKPEATIASGTLQSVLPWATLLSQILQEL